MISECSRVVSLDRIGPTGLAMTVEATPAECSALAMRMGLPAIHALRCTFELDRQRGDIIVARGHLHAHLRQTCVITLDDFDDDLEEFFQIRFVPEGEETEIVDPETDDEIPYTGNTIDIGEAAAEQLGLALDPYPRAPGAELPEQPADPEENPFAAMLRRFN
jgi:uncharacterized metal-binding protein YceD (DUF177 family)